jgi:hypothetical protein
MNYTYLEDRELGGERSGLRLQDLHLLLQLGSVAHPPLLGPRRRLPVRQHPTKQTLPISSTCPFQCTLL